MQTLSVQIVPDCHMYIHNLLLCLLDCRSLDKVFDRQRVEVYLPVANFRIGRDKLPILSYLNWQVLLSDILWNFLVHSPLMEECIRKCRELFINSNHLTIFSNSFFIVSTPGKPVCLYLMFPSRSTIR